MTFFVSSVLMALLALLLLASPVAAFNCREDVNPHGYNIPPAGWPTEPGTNPNSGYNPDGFCTITGGSPPAGAPVRIYYGYEGNERAFGPFDYLTVVKYTEAPGVDP